jgi:hypothetical protein
MKKKIIRNSYIKRKAISTKQASLITPYNMVRIFHSSLTKEKIMTFYKNNCWLNGWDNPLYERSGKFKLGELQSMT